MSYSSPVLMQYCTAVMKGTVHPEEENQSLSKQLKKMETFDRLHIAHQA